MIYDFLNEYDRKLFSEHYNSLRSKNLILEIIDIQEILDFFLANVIIHFEVGRLEESLNYIGLVECGKKKKRFVIGLLNEKLILFDKLEYFLKIK